MIKLEDGLSLCGRCVWGYEVGHIIDITSRTYTIRWRDGDTTLLRPDIDSEDEVADDTMVKPDFLFKHARPSNDNFYHRNDLEIIRQIMERA